MPGHDQTDIRFRRRRAAWVVLALGVASLAAGSGRAAAQDAVAATWKGPEAAAIRLSADQVQTWQDDGNTWLLLEDKARVEQGGVALTAQRMVVQVLRSGTSDGNLFRVNLYAEGDVRDPGQPVASFKAIRTALRTADRVTDDALVPNGRHKLAAPPVGLPILARALDQPADAAVERAEAPAAEPTIAEAPAAEPVPPATPGRLPVVPTQLARSGDAPVAEVASAGSPLAMPFGSISATAPPVVPGVPERASAAVDANRVDPAVAPAQQAVGGGAGFPATGTAPGGFPDEPGPITSDPIPGPSSGAATLPDALPADSLPFGPNIPQLGPQADDLNNRAPTNVLPLPDDTLRPEAGDPGPRTDGTNGQVVVDPGSQRIIEIQPRGQTEIRSEEPTPDGTQVFLIRNGVNILMQSPEQGIVDLEADNVVIWIRQSDKTRPAQRTINNQIFTKSTQPIEFYLEGHVVVRQDQEKILGKADQRTYKANKVYYDVQQEKILALDTELELFAPGLITPTKLKSPRILQYHPVVPGAVGPMGQPVLSKLAAMEADQTVTTGSRFANPGYRFNSSKIYVDQVVDSQARPNQTGLPYDENDLTWQIDARQNFFYFGPVPAFYWPRLYVEADDINPPLQGLGFATNNYFGQQIRSDFDVFNILGRRHVPEIDSWNFDLDYLSARDKTPGQGIALGTEVGWYGNSLFNDIADPFHKKPIVPSRFGAYAGYFDAYALFDGSRDVLGLGPAIITNGTNNNAAGRLGGPGSFFSRLSNPTYQDFRGRITARHMQSFNTPADPVTGNGGTPLDEDTRVNFEIGLTSDRNFLEQYYKRLFDTGLDQENLVYAIRQKQNQTFTFQSEVNLQTFYTDTQWLPKLDYYRLGDSLLNDRLTYFGHTGVDYANVHTAAEVNNRTLFAYLPTDPISNTNRRFESGRLYSSHEIDAPLNLGFLRVTPYLQGQAVGWNNQINDHAVGRIWGAFGARADVTFWKVYPDAESELFNVHGINHKIDLVADYRDAFSNVNLNSLGVQDDLDDNTYEYSRRYFALTNYGGGILPAQYDPRLLILRRALSPITGTTDIQATIETLKLGIHQRLQTKRGQEGRRHINDYITFDLDTTYFPNAARDNFNKPFGQNFYNFEWYIGDRTSFVSYGWFEFFKIGGDPTTINNNLLRNDPFGLHIITSGLSLTRIPRGNIFIGYTIVNTGPISTSALNAAYSYWLSPKWFGTTGASYDFGNDQLLAATGSFTRIGADYLTSVGLIVSPLQHSYQFQFEISPRLTPNLRAGSSSGLTRLDSRFAPVE